MLLTEKIKYDRRKEKRDTFKQYEISNENVNETNDDSKEVTKRNNDDKNTKDNEIIRFTLVLHESLITNSSFVKSHFIRCPCAILYNDGTVRIFLLFSLFVFFFVLYCSLLFLCGT